MRKQVVTHRVVTVDPDEYIRRYGNNFDEMVADAAGSDGLIQDDRRVDQVELGLGMSEITWFQTVLFPPKKSKAAEFVGTGFGPASIMEE